MPVFFGFCVTVSEPEIHHLGVIVLVSPSSLSTPDHSITVIVHSLADKCSN